MLKTIVSILVVSCVLLSCNTGNNNQSKNDSENKEVEETVQESSVSSSMKTYSNPYFSIEYPSDWQYIENVNEMTDVSIGSTTEPIAMTVVRFKTDANLKEAHQMALEGAREGGQKVLNDKLITINGYQCYKYDITMTYAGVLYQQQYYTLMKGDMLYNLSFGNTKEMLEKYHNVIQQMVNSFDMK